MRAVRRVTFLLAALSVALTSAVVASSQAGAAAVRNVLYAGQSTTALATPSGQFQLNVLDGAMYLTQRIGHVSTTVWGATHRFGGIPRGAKLVMQNDGNAVLRNNAGRVVWSTHTTGTGAHNRFMLLGNGNLTVYTASGKRVWSSGSGPAAMVTGNVLSPGQYLRSREDETRPWVRLVMQPDGNLVLTMGKAVHWSSGTHVRGSRLVGLPDGNWAIYTPQRKPIWSTGTALHKQTLLMALPAVDQANLAVYCRAAKGNVFNLVR